MELVDQWGQPLPSYKFLKASNQYNGNQPSEFIRPFDPLKKLISYRDWLTTSYLADKLYANFGIVEGAIAQKAMFAVGNAWKPVFLGEDQAWGEEARHWLINDWYPASDIRGPNYDFVTNLYQQSVSIDRSGDTIELTLVDENGWPYIQSVPCRQIGQWEVNIGPDYRLNDGEYDGAQIVNGVIMDEHETPIAYRKLGDVVGEYEDLPAECVIHTFEPKWNEQARGFPIFSSCIDDFRMIAKSEEWEQQAMLIASAIGLLEYNEGGEAETPETDPLGLAGDNQTPYGLQARMLQGGLIRYLKSGSGKLEQFVSHKPGDDWEKFCDRQIRKALAAANWSYSLVWKPDGTNGTVQRSELLKVRNSVTDRQALLRPRAKRKVGFAVSAAIEAGFIRPYPGKDLGGHLKWDFTMPGRISIDEGRERQQRREDNKFGLVLDSTIVEEEGEITYRDHCRRRWKDAITLEEERIAAEKRSGLKLDPRLGKMMTPNEAPATDEDEDKDADQKP